MKLNNLIKQLHPTGRAFKFPIGGNGYLVHDAMNEVIETAITDTKSILNTILPDNDNFTEEDAAIWETRLGLPGGGTFTERKLAILRKINYPGNTLGRLSKSYFEAQLQAAGFNVYVHANKFDDGSGGFTVINPGDGSGSYTQHGIGIHGVSVFGSTGFPYDSVITNHDDKTYEIIPEYTDYQLRSTFFIGAQVWPGFASVSSAREKEFRKLILTLKAQHSVGYLLINYV